MSEHKHGSMDIREQEGTFSGFVKFTTWATVAIIIVLLFVAFTGA